MKIPKQCKIEKAASKDKAREILNHILIDSKDGESQAVATDGKMMAIVPITLCDGDEVESEKLIQPKALIEARKQARQARESSIGLNGAATMPDGASYPTPNSLNDKKFPHWRNIVPKGGDYQTVCFNAKALFELAQAIGAVNDKVTLQIPIGTGTTHDGGPLVIEEKTTGAKGILMPMRDN